MIFPRFWRVFCWFFFPSNSPISRNIVCLAECFSQDSISSPGGKPLQSHLLTVCPSSSPPSLLICVPKYTPNYVYENVEIIRIASSSMFRLLVCFYNNIQPCSGKQQNRLKITENCFWFTVSGFADTH